jgi:large subunit ribosomal protein L24
MPARVKKGDTVMIIAGKDRGKTGEVIRIDPKKQKVWVEGLNLIRRHERPSPLPGATQQQKTGGVIEAPGPLHLSNVMPLDPESGKPTRVGTVEVEGTKHRVARRSGKQID